MFRFVVHCSQRVPCVVSAPHPRQALGGCAIYFVFGGNKSFVVESPTPTNLNDAVTRLRDEVTSVLSVDVLPCFCTRDGLRTIAQLRSLFNELMTAGWLVVMYICLPSATYADATAFIR